jgi:hypothetical protein
MTFKMNGKTKQTTVEGQCYQSWSWREWQCQDRKKKGKPAPIFEITLDDVIAKYHKQRGRCALSGQPFNFEFLPPGSGRKPDAVSIDRINPAKGYTKDNIRLVWAQANIARNAWSDQQLLKLALGIVSHLSLKTETGSIPVVA